MQPTAKNNSDEAVKSWLFKINALLIHKSRLGGWFYRVLYFVEMAVELTLLILGLVIESNLVQILQVLQRWQHLLILIAPAYWLLVAISYHLRNNLSASLQILHATLLLAYALTAPLLVLLPLAARAMEVYACILLTVGAVSLLAVVFLYHTIHLQFSHEAGSIVKSVHLNLFQNRLAFLTSMVIVSSLINMSPITLRAGEWACCLGYIYQFYCLVWKGVLMTRGMLDCYVLTLLVRLNYCLMRMLSDIGIAIVSNNGPVFMGVFLLFEMAAYLNFIDYEAMRILLKEGQWVNNSYEIEVYLRTFGELNRNDSSQVDRIYYCGIVKAHQQQCTDVDCRCRQRLEEEANASRYDPFVMVLIQSLKKHHDDSYLLMLHEVYAGVEVLQAYPQASRKLQRLISNNPSPTLTQQWLHWDARQRISEAIHTSQDASSLEFDVLKYEELNKLMISELTAFLAICIDKARLMLEPLVDAIALEEICSQQLLHVTAVRNLYRKMCQACPRAMDVRKLLYEYSLNLLLDGQAASQALSDIVDTHNSSSFLDKPATTTDYRDVKACVLELEHENEQRLGTIIFCSSRTSSLLGVGQKDILGKPLSSFLPKQLEGEFYDKLKSWSSTGNWELFGHHQQLILQNGSRVLLCVRAFARICPGENGFRLLLWLQGLPNRQVGLLDCQGRILGTSLRLHRLCPVQDAFLQIFCPQFGQVLSKTRSTSEGELGQYEMYMLVPTTSQIDTLSRQCKKHKEVPPDQCSTHDLVLNQQKQLVRCRVILLCNFLFRTISSSGNRYILLELNRGRKATITELKSASQTNEILRECCDEQIKKPLFPHRGDLDKAAHNKRSISGISSNAEVFEPSEEFVFEEDDEVTKLAGSEGDLLEDLAAQSKSSYLQSLVDFTFKKVMQVVRDKFLRPQPSKLARVATVFVTLIILALVGIILGQYFVGYLGLDSYMDTIFADAAVSDNMQLLQMFYGKAIQYYQYFDEISGDRFRYLLRNAQSLSNFLYSLIVYDHQRLNQDAIYSGRLFYEYLEIKVPLDDNVKTSVVSTTQFMEWYYKSIRQLTSDMQAGSFTQQSLNSMDVLVSNWNTMKSINHNNLAYYQLMGSQLVRIIAVRIYVLLAGSVLLSAAVSLLYYAVRLKSQLKLNQSLNLYEHVTTAELRTYCERYKLFIASTKVGQQLEESLNYIMDSDSFEKKKQMNKTFLKKEIRKGTGWFILLFVVLNIANLLNSGTVLLFLDPCEQMMHSINSLMDSENYQLEALFDLKTYYLYKQGDTDQKSFTDKFLRESQHLQVPFVKAATDSIRVFGEYDSLYGEQITSLLISDICEVTKVAELEDWEREKCRSGFNTGLLKQGILGAMSTIQRLIIEAALELNRTGIASARELFKRPIYEDIDDSILYMFRVYQITQARMVEAMNLAVGANMSLMLSVCILETLFLLGLLVMWAWVYRNQRDSQRSRYGFILLICPEIISNNKSIKTYISRSITIGLK